MFFPQGKTSKGEGGGGGGGGGGWLLWVKMAGSYNSTERRGEIIIEIKKSINRICLIAWLTICKTSLCLYVQVVRAVCLLE